MDSFTGKCYQIFKKVTSILHNTFQKIEEDKTYPKYFYEVTITLMAELEKESTKKKEKRKRKL